jgi:hypothetical protein
MFNINFLPGWEFEIEYLKKNHPELWDNIEYEIKGTINGHISILSFCLFIAVVFLGIVNIIPESEMYSSIKWLFNIIIAISCFIGIRATYQEIIHWNNKYFGVPYISYQIVTEMRNSASILREEKVLNEIVSNNIIKKNSKTIAKSRL